MKHTLEQLEALSDEELRVILAEICGWQKLSKRVHAGLNRGYYQVRHMPSGKNAYDLPNYPRSLDSCAEVEEAQLFTDALRHDYVDWLDVIMDCRSMICEKSTTFATARQRTIALILTLQPQDS